MGKADDKTGFKELESSFVPGCPQGLRCHYPPAPAQKPQHPAYSLCQSWSHRGSLLSEGPSVPRHPLANSSDPPCSSFHDKEVLLAPMAAWPCPLVPLASTSDGSVSALGRVFSVSRAWLEGHNAVAPSKFFSDSPLLQEKTPGPLSHG